MIQDNILDCYTLVYHENDRTTTIAVFFAYPPHNFVLTHNYTDYRL